MDLLEWIKVVNQEELGKIMKIIKNNNPTAVIAIDEEKC